MVVSNILLQSLINPPQADFSGAISQGQSNALVNRINTAKAEATEFATTPEALARTQSAEEAKIKAVQNKAAKDAKDLVNSATDRERDDLIRTATQFSQVDSVEGLQAFAGANPIDAKELGITDADGNFNAGFFGSEDFQNQREISDIVLDAERTRAGLERAPVRPGALKEVTLPGGKPGFVRDRGDGEFEIALGPDNQPLTPKPGSRQRITVDPKTGLVTFEQGTLGGPTSGPVATAVAQHRDKRTGMNALVRNSQRFIADIEAAPNSATVLASLAQFGNSVRNNMRALVQELGTDFEFTSVEDLLNNPNMAGFLDAAGLAGTGNQIRAGVLSLALQIAAVNGLGTGRALTEKDVERAIGQTGADSSDPLIIKNTLQSTLRGLRIRVEEDAKNRSFVGVDFVPLLDVDFGQPATPDGLQIIDLRPEAGGIQ